MMVSQVRDGISQRAVARSFRVSLSTVQRWVARAGDLPLDEVDWDARPAGCRVSPRRTKAGVEQRVLVIRRQLRTKSDLGGRIGRRVRLCRGATGAPTQG